MYVLKSFIGIGNAIDNTHKVVATYGEISTKSLTYSKDVQRFTDAEYDGLQSYVFTSRTDGERVDVKMGIHKTMMSVANYIYQRGLSGYNNISSDDLLVNLDLDYTGVITDISVGEMVTDGVIYMPTVVRFVIENPTGLSSVIMWMSDTTFQEQYDEFEIDVIPPLDDVDLLMTSNENVRDLTRELNISKTIERLEDRTKLYPYTLVRMFEFPLVDLNNPEDRVILPWSVAIYGLAGDNIDAIYDAITKYILTNSQYEREHWNERLPKLFKRIEFTIIPNWDSYSVPNKSIEAGLYSPVIRHVDVPRLVESYVPTYNLAHAINYAATSAFLYRSIGFIITSSSDNRDNVFDVTVPFKDFSLISTTHHDFKRISPKTQDLIMLLSEMFYVAESMTEFSKIPVNMSRVRREGSQYLVATIDQIQFYVLSKSSFAG